MGIFQLKDFVEVSNDLKEFKFSFRVQERNFSLQTETLSQTDAKPGKVDIKGEFRFSDAVKKEEVEKTLFVSNEKGEKLPFNLIPTDNSSRYILEINDIPRQDQDYQLTITADGTSIGIDRKLNVDVLIPAQNSFRFLSAERIEQPENGIQLTFSSPISTTQDLTGLIEIPEISTSTFQVKDNKVFTSEVV